MTSFTVTALYAKVPTELAHTYSSKHTSHSDGFYAHLLIHLFYRCLLSDYYVSGIVLGAKGCWSGGEYNEVPPCPYRTYILVKERNQR